MDAPQPQTDAEKAYADAVAAFRAVYGTGRTYGPTHVFHANTGEWSIIPSPICVPAPLNMERIQAAVRQSVYLWSL